LYTKALLDVRSRYLLSSRQARPERGAGGANAPPENFNNLDFSNK